MKKRQPAQIGDADISDHFEHPDIGQHDRRQPQCGGDAPRGGPGADAQRKGQTGGAAFVRVSSSPPPATVADTGRSVEKS